METNVVVIDTQKSQQQQQPQRKSLLELNEEEQQNFHQLNCDKVLQYQLPVEKQQQQQHHHHHQSSLLTTDEITVVEPVNNSIPEVTSKARVVREVQSTDKTTINIGVAMNHVNDQENLKQLNLTPVQVNEVEDMDTQEGELIYFF